MAAAGAPDAAALPDAPVFRPSLEEFAHPQRYLERIAGEPAVRAAGIAVIVPPLEALVPAGLVRAGVARRGAHARELLAQRSALSREKNRARRRAHFACGVRRRVRARLRAPAAR